MRTQPTTTILRHVALIAILAIATLGSVDASAGCRKAPSTEIAEFIALGDNMALLHEAELKNDLWRNYKLRDVFELDYLYTFCGKSWGTVAYVLALEGATKIKATDLVAVREIYKNWEEASAYLKVTDGRCRPRYKLEVYLERQRMAWRRMIDNSQYIR